MNDLSDVNDVSDFDNYNILNNARISNDNLLILMITKRKKNVFELLLGQREAQAKTTFGSRVPELRRQIGIIDNFIKEKSQCE